MEKIPFWQNQSLQSLGDRNRKIFVLFCSYYIFATYLLPSSGSIQQYSPEYFALVFPAWLYVWIQRRFIFQINSWIAIFWWIFIASVLLVSIFQGSASLAYNGVYLGLVALVIINSGGYLRTVELNIIFLMTIAGSIVVYYLGISNYTIIPWSPDQSCHQSLGFRVSLFRVISESAALSFFVILWNIFSPPARQPFIRWFFIFLAIYFLFFSGIRTLILSALIVSPLLLFGIMSGTRLWIKVFVSTLIPTCFIAVVSIFILVPNIDYGVKNILASYVFRADSCSAISVMSHEKKPVDLSSNTLVESGLLERSLNDLGISTTWLLSTINRQCTAKYQLGLFIQNPLIGNLSTRPDANNKMEFSGCTQDALDRYCDACVLSTYWLSRGGISGIVLVGIYILTLLLAIRRRSVFGIAALVSFGLFMQGWGVMFMPYNFSFFMLMSLFPLIFSLKHESISLVTKK